MLCKIQRTRCVRGHELCVHRTSMLSFRISVFVFYDTLSYINPLCAPSFMLSGFSHVRYDHSSRPRVYDVACPKCAARASAHKDSETEMGNVIGDLAGTWHLDDWRITCLSCDYRESDAAYAQLPPPFFRVTSRGTNLWAFNLSLIHI